MEAIGIIEALKDVQMLENIDLVLDLNQDSNGDEFIGYYFADHERRIVLFAHEFPSSCLPHWFEIQGISSGTHLRMSSLLRQVKNDISHLR